VLANWAKAAWQEQTSRRSIAGVETSFVCV
jgi:hypothetical protein